MSHNFSPVDLNETAGFYEQYYAAQEGTGLAVFSGKRYMDQDGLGLMSVMKSAFKAVAPTLKRAGKSALQSLGKQAINVTRDVLEGKKFNESTIRGLKRAGTDFLDGMGDTHPRKRAKSFKSKGVAKRGKKERTGDVFS